MISMRALIAIALLVVTAGCGVLNPEEQESVSYEVTENVTALDVHTGSGQIEIVASDRTGVFVTENLSWRSKRPTTSHPVTNGKLILSYDCSSGINVSCEVGYRLEVPRNVNIKADTGSGEIRGTGLGTGTVRLDTGSGGIDLDFSGVPGEVRVETGSGDVTARLPRGSYAVQTDTGSGREKVDVVRDPNAPNKFFAKTGSGDITISAV